MAGAVVNKSRVFIIIGAMIIIALIIALAVTLAVNNGDDDCPATQPAVTQGPSTPAAPQALKLDCYPEAQGGKRPVNEEQCKTRGCMFEPNPSAGEPGCYYKEGQYSLKVQQMALTATGVTVELSQIGNAPFGGDIRNWTFSFTNHGDDMARFKFDVSSGDRYQVPVPLFRPAPTPTSDSQKYELKVTDTDNFAFQILRKATGTVLFDTSSGPGSLILSDQFLQLTTRLTSPHVYGLGEHAHDSFRHDLSRTWGSFSRDQPPPWTPEANLYGVHPFYTCVEEEQGNTHGVFMFNSNSQEYSFAPTPSLTFRTIGGILDFYIFLGPSPELVVQQYTALIGRPMMPPYWSLGFQQCRYGYNNIENLREAVETTKAYDIPHDVQYVDIDHMDTRKIFTVDNASYPDLDGYFKSLQAEGMRIIYILDPCLISNETGYVPYERMKAVDGNVKWHPDAQVPANRSDPNGAILGYVWPQGPVVFPDFLKKEVNDIWAELIVDHSKQLTFDGLWIDMNEPASFGTNEERPFNWPENVRPYWSLHCPVNALDDPPYRTKAAYLYDYDDGSRQGRLSDKTFCMHTVQGEGGVYSHYDVHSLYGYSQSESTLRAARQATGQRSIVISRSTFPGSGRYVGHWLGDNESAWKDLKTSIIGMLEFNLFGIPYIGADICGFFQNTTVELCKRWMQLGAFYPFSRNHNGIGFIVQGPGQLGDDVGNASRDIMRVRYRLLPYLYLLFHQSHTQGGTVVRPLHHEFPTDQRALAVDSQFLWGSCLLISPILEKGQTSLTYYLPAGKWYDYYSHRGVSLIEGADQTQGVNDTSMPALHVRGGCVLVEQGYANNTHFSRQQKLTILAALDSEGNARGSFFWDDGDSLDTYDKGEYFMTDLEVANNTLTTSIAHRTTDTPPWAALVYEKLVILGVDTPLASVTVNGNQAIPVPDADTGSVVVPLNDFPMVNTLTVTWISAAP
ncbi:maltase-glucoamylase, intestinal [Aplysia californica]|uniref:Maltase-glucoamylase, intestinal n=1 Tax=Aplysia californica TaxID=6500 RepID=A0ABM1ABN1_APLCA|nr:maltase-glucoamylase, intestinal [Aplysia californica]